MYNDIRYLDLLIQFELVDVNAKGDATASTTGQAVVSQPSQILGTMESNTQRYATSEENFWVLDGSFNIYPDDISDIKTGYVGTIGISTLTLTLTEAADSVGFTLHFDTLYDVTTKIKVSAYSSNNVLLDTKTYENNDYVFVAEMMVLQYSKVVFEFLEPTNRRARVLQADFGILQTYDKNNVTKATITQEFSLTNEDLPTNELEFTFDNSSRNYNLNNAEGIYKYVQEGQDMIASVVVDGTPYKTITCKFAEVESDDTATTAKMTGYDALYFLDEQYFTLQDETARSLGDALDLVLEDLPHSTSITTQVIIDCDGESKREVLRLLAEATNAIIITENDGTIVFKNVDEEIKEVLDFDNTENYAVAENTSSYDKVTVTVGRGYTYTAGTGDREKKITNDFIVSQAQTQAVAEELLVRYNLTVKNSFAYRGNPQRNVGDAITIPTVYGEDINLILVSQEFEFAGGLKATAKGVNI